MCSRALVNTEKPLDQALEQLDLAADPQLANRIIEAIEATDEAHTLATEDTAPPCPDGKRVEQTGEIGRRAR